MSPFSPIASDGGPGASRRLATACRWSARVIGLLQVATAFGVAAAQGLPNPLHQPAEARVGFAALLGVFLGNLAGWKWPLAGGLLSLAGSLVFIVFEVGFPPTGVQVFVWGLGVPGALFVLGWFLGRLRAAPKAPLIPDA